MNEEQSESKILKKFDFSTIKMSFSQRFEKKYQGVIESQF